jgi:hypothetical protein
MLGVGVDSLRRHAGLWACVAIAPFVIGAGCASDNDDHRRSDDRYGRNDRYDSRDDYRDDYRGTYRDGYRDEYGYNRRTDGRYDPRYDRDGDVPRSAREVDRDKDKVIHTARGAGRFYLVDCATRQLIYKIDVRDGQEFKADAREDYVYIDDRRYERLDMRRDNELALYFDPAEGRETRQARLNSRDNASHDDRNRNNSGNTTPIGPVREQPREVNGIPTNAKSVTEGNGTISHKFDKSGTAYVVDDRGHLVFKIRISDGQRLTISPQQKIATLDGKTVFTGVNRPRHKVLVVTD